MKSGIDPKLEAEANRMLEEAGIDPERACAAPETPNPCQRWDWASKALRGAAEAVCTDRQLEAFVRRYEGETFEAIGQAIGGDKASAKRLVDRAEARIRGVLGLGDNFRALGMRGHS